MSCMLCENQAEKSIRLYGHTPDSITVCVKHSWELFLTGERRFMVKHKKHLAAQFKPSDKKTSVKNSSRMGQFG